VDLLRVGRLNPTPARAIRAPFSPLKHACPLFLLPLTEGLSSSFLHNANRSWLSFLPRADRACEKEKCLHRCVAGSLHFFVLSQSSPHRPGNPYVSLPSPAHGLARSSVLLSRIHPFLPPISPVKIFFFLLCMIMVSTLHH